MKKVFLILTTVLFLFSCSNNENKNSPVAPPDDNIAKNLVVDTNSSCFIDNIKVKVLVTHNDNSTEVIGSLSKQPNFEKCLKPNTKTWCLYDAKTDSTISTNVKSFKFLESYLDSENYFICQKSLIK